jgi:hypothetical protein
MAWLIKEKASLLAASSPSMGFSSYRNRHISFAEEYNAGIQQQLANNLVLNPEYVGSVDWHEYTEDVSANTAEYPGPGNPQLRVQYGRPAALLRKITLRTRF